MSFDIFGNMKAGLKRGAAMFTNARTKPCSVCNRQLAEDDQFSCDYCDAILCDDDAKDTARGGMTEVYCPKHDKEFNKQKKNSLVDDSGLARGRAMFENVKYPDLRWTGDRFVHIPCQEAVYTGGSSNPTEYECHECGKTWPRNDLERAPKSAFKNNDAGANTGDKKNATPDAAPHDPDTCDDVQCPICAEIDPHMTEHGIVGKPKKVNSTGTWDVKMDAKCKCGDAAGDHDFEDGVKKAPCLVCDCKQFDGQARYDNGRGEEIYASAASWVSTNWEKLRNQPRTRSVAELASDFSITRSEADRIIEDIEDRMAERLNTEPDRSPIKLECNGCGNKWTSTASSTSDCAGRCPKCDSNRIKERKNAARFERPCPDCGGMGYVEDANGNDVKCGKCKGTGVESVDKLPKENADPSDGRRAWMKAGAVKRGDLLARAGKYVTGEDLGELEWDQLPSDVRGAIVLSVRENLAVDEGGALAEVIGGVEGAVYNANGACKACGHAADLHIDPANAGSALVLCKGKTSGPKTVGRTCICDGFIGERTNVGEKHFVFGQPDDREAACGAAVSLNAPDVSAKDVTCKACIADLSGEKQNASSKCAECGKRATWSCEGVDSNGNECGKELCPDHANRGEYDQSQKPIYCPSCRNNKAMHNAVCVSCGNDHTDDQPCYPKDVLNSKIAGVARGNAKYGSDKKQGGLK